MAPAFYKKRQLQGYEHALPQPHARNAGSRPRDSRNLGPAASVAGRKLHFGGRLNLCREGRRGY